MQMKVHNLPKVVTKNDFPQLGVEPGSLDPKANTLPTEPSRPHLVQAVTTRQMKKNDVEPLKLLKVTENLQVNISREEVICLQKGDESLDKYWNKAYEHIEEIKEREERFKIKRGLLYREFKSRDGRVVSQLVLPIEVLSDQGAICFRCNERS
jgi:hypothetical protein